MRVCTILVASPLLLAGTLMTAGFALVSGITAQSGAPRAKAPSAEDLRDAHWVRGRVIVPAGTPADERTSVVADASALPAFDRHTVPVEADGKFRVAFAQDAQRGKLTLQSRWLCLDPDVAWKATDGDADVELRPVLAGVLRARIALPADTQKAERDEVLAADVEIEGTPLAPGRAALQRTARVGDDMLCEVPALPDGYEWTATICAGPFVPLVTPALRVTPGKVLSLEWSLQRGASVRGKVVDEDGHPVARASIALVQHDDPLAPMPRDTQEVKSGDDGTFEIRGSAPGVVTMWAEREGWIATDLDLAPLAAGEVREGVVLVLRAGHVLAGHVLLPGGKPAARARVRITQSRLGQPDLVREIDTPADGSFAARGLGDDPVDVVATGAEEWIGEQDRAPAGGAGRTRAEGDARAKHRQFLRATALHVEPSQPALVLQLVAGMGVEGRVHDDLGRLVQSFGVYAQHAGEAERPIPPRSLDVRTPDGTFALDGLDAGAWDVFVSGRGLAQEVAQRIDVPYAGDPLVFVVRRTATVAGTLVDAHETTFDDVQVQLSWRVPGRPRATNTKSVLCARDGRFEIEGAQPGTVTLVATRLEAPVSAPITLELAPGERKEGVPVTLAAEAPR